MFAKYASDGKSIIYCDYRTSKPVDVEPENLKKFCEFTKKNNRNYCIIKFIEVKYKKYHIKNRVIGFYKEQYKLEPRTQYCKHFGRTNKIKTNDPNCSIPNTINYLNKNIEISYSHLAYGRKICLSESTLDKCLLKTNFALLKRCHEIDKAEARLAKERIKQEQEQQQKIKQSQDIDNSLVR